MPGEWFKTWFDTGYYHLLYEHRDENEARLFLDALLHFLNPPAACHFLDVACGTGRHSRYLSEKGFRATGFDLSSNSIEAAKKHPGDHLRFLVHDMRQPLPFADVDIALNLFTSFGYFEDDDEHIRSLENIRNALRPEGLFVMDYLNAGLVCNTLVHSETHEVDGIGFTLGRSLEDGFITKRITVSDSGKKLTFSERVRAYHADDLVQLFTRAGFCIASIFGDYALNAFGAHSPRVIIIAQKPA